MEFGHIVLSLLASGLWSMAEWNRLAKGSGLLVTPISIAEDDREQERLPNCPGKFELMCF
jgi:hypothetical protein